MKLLKNLSVKDCIGLHSAVVSYKVTDCFLRISNLESFSYGRFQGGSWGDRQVRNSCSLPCGLEIPNPDPQQWLRQKANGSLPSLGRSQAEVIQKKLAPCITELRSGAARPASWDLGYSQAWAFDLELYIWCSASAILLSASTVRCDFSRAGALSLSPRDVCVCVKFLSRVWLSATPWTVACQAPLSMNFFRQEYWSGLPFPSLGDLPDPGIKPRSPALQADALPSELLGKPRTFRDVKRRV